MRDALPGCAAPLYNKAWGPQARDAALDTVVVTYFSGVVTSSASQVRDAALDTVVVTYFFRGRYKFCKSSERCCPGHGCYNLFFQGSLQVLQVK